MMAIGNDGQTTFVEYSGTKTMKVIKILQIIFINYTFLLLIISFFGWVISMKIKSNGF